MADCNDCKEKQRQAEPIPYVAFESMKATMERTTKRMWVLLIILAALLVASNIGWIIYESQFETVTETTIMQEVQQEAETGSNRFIGGDYYGEANNQD